jgi:hypothetical protein
MPWNGNDPMLNQIDAGRPSKPKRLEGPKKKLQTPNPIQAKKNKNFLEVCSQVYGSKIHPIRYEKAGILMIYPAYSSSKVIVKYEVSDVNSRTMNTL